MLHTLKPARGSRKRRKRLGRGVGSGRGTFCTRGVKGQKARAGGGKGPQFEGGQTPLIRRQPKRGGFRSPTWREYAIVNLDTLEERLEPGGYDATALREARLVHGKLPVKVLGRGSVSKKFDLRVDAASKGARKAVEEAGGSIRYIT